MAAHVTIGGIDYPVVFDPPGAQANILQLNEITNPSGLKLYAVKEDDADPDRFITYANLLQAALKNTDFRFGIGTSDGTSGQSIAFDSDISSATYALFIYDNSGALGVKWTSKSLSGFVIDSIDSGDFVYLAIVIS